jgi:hypothetical protein
MLLKLNPEPNGNQVKCLLKKGVKSALKPLKKTCGIPFALAY